MLPLLALLAGPVLAQDGPAPGPGELRLQGLLVGVDRFASWRVPELAYAKSDARSFRDALVRGSGGAWSEEALPLLSDEQATLETVRARLRSLLLEAGEDDVVLFFFSGHGYVVDGKGYLYVYDTATETLPTSGLPVAELQGWVEQSKARHVLLFTDACHAASVGTLRGGGMPEDNAFNEVIGSLERSEGSIFNLASSLVQQKSYEGWQYCGGGGAFTCALTEALSGDGDLDGDGVVELAELSTRVQQRVMEMTGYVQTPEAKGDYDPNLALTAPRAVAAGGAEALTELYEAEAGATIGAVLGTEGFGSLGLLASGGGLLGELAPEPVQPEVVEHQPHGDDEVRWREPFRPWLGLSLAGGLTFGATDPTLGADGAGSYGSGLRPHGQLRLALHHGWWFHPGLEVSVQDALRVYGDQPGGHTARLGLALREELHLFPYRTWDPYVVLSGGSWGGRWADDVLPTDPVWQVSPLSAPWAVGAGAGLLWAPWWAGLGALNLEVVGYQLLGGEAGPLLGSASTALRSSVGIEWAF